MISDSSSTTRVTQQEPWVFSQAGKSFSVGFRSEHVCVKSKADFLSTGLYLEDLGRGKSSEAS